MNLPGKLIYGWKMILVVIMATLAPVAPAMAQGETVCIQCHSSQSGRALKPVKPWQESIHAENGISCHNCHGGDAKDAANAMNPERGFLGAPRESDIPAFCGRCHIGIKGDFITSAHGRALGKGGPTCVTCHGSHEIRKATLDLINEKTCSQCHSYDRARTIRQAMEQTENTLSSLSGRLESFKGQGVATVPLEKRLFSQRNRYRSLFHEVDTVKVKDESARIAAELKALQTVLDKIDSEHRQRRIIGVFAVSATLLAALLLLLLRRTYSH